MVHRGAHRPTICVRCKKVHNNIHPHIRKAHGEENYEEFFLKCCDITNKCFYTKIKAFRLKSTGDETIPADINGKPMRSQTAEVCDVFKPTENILNMPDQFLIW